MRLTRLKGDKGAAAGGSGCSGLSCSMGGLAPTSPVRSSLSPDEVWRRLLAAILEGGDIGPDDAVRIFGIPPAAIRESRAAKINLGFVDSSVRVFSFYLGRRPCPSPSTDGCVRSGSVTELSISYLADAPGTACINNGALAARFVQAGWREPQRKAGHVDPRTAPIDSEVPAFDVFVRPGAEAYLTPSRQLADECISQILYIVRTSEEK